MPTSNTTKAGANTVLVKAHVRAKPGKKDQGPPAPPSPTGVFAPQPLAATVAPILAAPKAAQRAHQRAEEAVPGASVPGAIRVPTLHTHEQRLALLKIASDVTRSARQAGVDVNDEAASGDKVTRDFYSAVADAKNTEAKNQQVRQGMQAVRGAPNVPQADKDALHQAAVRNLLAPKQRDILAGMSPERAVAKAIPKPTPSSFLGETKIGGVPVPGLHQLGFTAGKALEQFDRPLHGIAGALYASDPASHLHESVTRAFWRGIQNKEHFTASDLLKLHGGSGNTAVDLVASMGGDTLLNPLNAVTGGIRPVAAGLTADAERFTNLANEARAAGNINKAARYEAAASKAAEKAQTAPTNRGIRIGANFGQRESRMTSGATSARLLHWGGVTRAAEHLRNGKGPLPGSVRSLGQVFVPGFRPQDVSPAEWESARTGAKSAHGLQRTLSAYYTRRGRAVTRALKDAAPEAQTHDVGNEVLRAVEHAPVDTPAAVATRQAIGQLNLKQAKEVIPALKVQHETDQAALSVARQAVKDAKSELVRQEKTYAESVRGEGVAAGRSHILSRIVGDRAAEKAAQFHDLFAGGGQGARTAAEALTRGAENLQAAQEAHLGAEKHLAELTSLVRGHDAQAGAELPRTLARHADDLVRAMPSYAPELLGPKLGAVADTVKATNEEIAQRSTALGVPVAHRENYVTHQWDDVIRKTAKTQAARGGSPRPGGGRDVFSMGRQANQGSIEERNLAQELLHPERDQFLSTNPGALISARGAGLGRAAAKKTLTDHFINEGLAQPVSKEEIRAAANDARQSAGEHVVYSGGKVHHARDGLYVIGPNGLEGLRLGNGHMNTDAALKALRNNQTVFRMNDRIGDAFIRGPITIGKDPHKVGEGLDKFMAGMRSLFTVMNFPAYDLRNLTGDLFNSWLAGTKGRDVKDGFRAMRTQVARHHAEAHDLNVRYDDTSAAKVDIGGGRMIPMREALDRAEKSGGIGEGYFGGQRVEMMHTVAPDGTIVPLKQGMHPIDALRSMGQIREDSVRMGTWLGAKRRGMSDADAARWVNKHHFDYTDLTPAERTVLRRIFLFWTFPARNTPLQASRALSNPRPYTQFENAREEGAKESGLAPNWEHGLADYQQRGAGIPLKVMGHREVLYTGAPLTDLSRVGAITDPASELQQTISGVNPGIKDPIEYGTNHDFFFNSPIYRSGQTSQTANAKGYVPAPPELASVPLARQLLGMHKIADKTSGKPVWEMSAKADYWLRTTPQGGLLLQSFTPHAGSRGQTATEKLLSRSGVNVGPYDPKKIATNAYYKKLNELLAKRNTAKDLYGKQSQSYQDLARQVRELQQGARTSGVIAPSQRKHKPRAGITLGGAGGIKLGGVKIGG